MDRTMIAPWKAEEKELSERLYKKLQGLTLLFTPSDELRKCLTQDMFLKPNQHAFFHVMHFLCRALDPVEFKKRFYWPLSDKRSESSFRTATVEYLKHLNDKHNMNWNIKSYLVVMPGGIKFITFLLEFIALLVKEVTTQRERQLSCAIENTKVGDWNIKRFRRQNQMLKSFAAKYIADIDALMLKYNGNISILKKELYAIATDTGLTVKEIMSVNFHKDFNAANQNLFDLKFCKPATQLKALEEPLAALKDTVDKKQFKKSAKDNKINKKSLKDAIKAFNQQNLNHESQTSDEEIRMKSLIAAFNNVHAYVLESLNQIEATDYDYDFLNSELSTLRTEFEELEKQMKNFQQTVNVSRQQESQKLMHGQHVASPFRELSSERLMLNENKKAIMNVLLSKYVCTPPIKCDSMSNERVMNYRLPLLDQKNHQIKDDLEIFVAPSRCTRQLLKHDQSLKDLNSTMNRYKIIDPMQLLRTLQKSNNKIKPSALSHQERSDSNLSKLGSKWKERESLFTDGNKNNISQRTSAVTSLVDVTLKQEISFTTPKQNLTSNSKLFSKSSNCSANAAQMHHYSKKLSAVKKVQSASINLHNLSTSPSGRLEPLIKIQLNDATLNDTTLGTTKSCLVQDENDFNCENNQNLINSVESKLSVRDKCFECEEQLLNISDSVLKDISI